jgi:hypothetical protein
MRRPLSDLETIGGGAGVIGALCVGGLLGSMRGEVSRANAGLLLVLVIIAAAAVGGRWAGGATALAGAMAFDFFLTKPYGSLAIKSTDDIVTTILLLVAGISVGQFANTRWRDHEASLAGTEEVACLHRVASLTADGAGLIQIVGGVQREVATVLHLAQCRYEVDPTARDLPAMERTGRVDAPYVHLDDGFVLPEGGFTIPVRADGRGFGALVCTPATPSIGVSVDRRRTALVLADHLGLALAHGTSSAA